MDNAIFIMKANLFDPPGEKVVKGPEKGPDFSKFTATGYNKKFYAINWYIRL